MKIAYTFLTDEIVLSKEKDFNSFYNRIGLNTGNFLFANACRHLIKGTTKTGVGTNFDPNHVNKNYDALVIPAANWINNYSDWSPLIKTLSKLKIPLLVLGLGVQSSSFDKKDLKINKSSKDLLKVISDKSELISLRGFFTKKCCDELNIKNTVGQFEGIVTETKCLMIVTDVFNHIAGNLFVINLCSSSNFASQDNVVVFDHGFASHARIFVLGKTCIQDSVRNLITDFIRMASRY